MTTESRYSLWAIPEETAAKVFSGWIKTLASRFDAPIILPHMTVLRGIHGEKKDLAKKMTELTIKKYMVKPGEILVGQGRHTALAVKVKDSYDIRITQAKSSLVFGDAGKSFLNHISLLYGAIPEETRRRVAKEIEGVFPPSFFMTSMVLMNTTEQDENKWSELTRINLF